MKAIFISIFFFCFTNVCSGQSSLSNTPVSAAQEAAAQKWLADLYQTAVEYKGDSVILNAEAKRILSDSTYYSFLYPKQYDWRTVQVLLKRMNLKQAFWYLINLYRSEPENKELILKTIIPFDTMMEMDKIIVTTFYSYISFDPEVTTLVDGKPAAVNRPDIAEQKMLAAKEIVGHVLAHRASLQKK